MSGNMSENEGIGCQDFIQSPGKMRCGAGFGPQAFSLKHVLPSIRRQNEPGRSLNESILQFD